MAATQLPDDIISEILTHLLEYSDELFSDYSGKALLEPSYSSSNYLRVCKAWLCVSTPLLYKVVILRTTAQAEVLKGVVQSNKEFGLFIRKLRVEGGFGDSMHTILKYAPNITDLFLTLDIWGTDDTQGLCSGLPLISPHRIIAVDAIENSNEEKSYRSPNRPATQLLEALVELIPQWDKLETFYFPYIATVGRVFHPHPVLTARAEALASALARSPSLENLSMCEGDGLPAYIRQLVDVPSLQSLRFVPPNDRVDDWTLGHLCRIRDGIRSELNSDPRLNALVTYADLPQTITDPSRFRSLSQPRLRLASEDPAAARVFDLPQLTSLAESSGRTLEELNVTLRPRGFGQGLERTTKDPSESLNPLILAPFIALTRLTWNASALISFLAPPPGFSALHNLETLSIENESPSVLDIGLHLPLTSLRVVDISKYADVPASINFLQRHGSKLLHLSAPLEFLIEVNVFDLCTSLHTLSVLTLHSDSHSQVRALMENFFAASTPHPVLTQIRFDIRYSNDPIKPPVITMFERLEPERFPTLKEIQFTCLRWPTSEEAVRRSKWIQLSEVLRPKGIRLVDANGIGGTGTRVERILRSG
ncbi:hypothetical protein B0H13DRAFT_2491976 [Mycena leptocephala]|nr:hypothetical protein B0H13DRAFT_2491976 [Mycena leptocephala]